MGESKYSVIVTTRASDMLVRHVEFLSRVSIPAAKKLTLEYKKVLRELKKNPSRFPFLELDGVPTGLYRKYLFYRRYEIVFLIIDLTVYIDAVRDCRQDPDALAERLN